MNKKKNLFFESELWRTVKFTLFSISAGAIQIIAYELLDKLTGWPYWPKYLIALLLSVIWNFTLNRKFTFKSASNVPLAMLKVLGYYAVFTPLSTLFGNWLTEKCRWNGTFVTILNMLINFVTEYLFDKYFVFNDKIDKEEKEDEGI